MTVSEQDVDKAFDRAPRVVQEFIIGGEWTPIITGIGAEYRLHVDQIGKIAELNRNMLLGLVSPSEFLGGLLVAGIPEPEARQIMGEINEKIFKPLQEEMRKGGAVPAPATAPPPSQPMPAPSPRPMLPPPQVFVPLPPPAPSIVLSPMPPAQVRPAQPPQLGRSDLPNSAPLPPRTVLPGASAPVFHNPMPAPLRQQSEPPSNLPTGVPGPEFAPLPPVARPSSPQPVQPPPRPASGDPYHEPIE